MSSNHILQGKIKGPRESTEDARVARMHSTVRSTGRDGKLYNKIDDRDAQKYKVLDDEALKIEERRTNDLKRSIQLTNAGSKLGKDGLAKTVTVGHASHNTKLAANNQKFPIAGGAESKVVETIRNGDVGVVSGADAKHNDAKSADAKSSAVKISTNTHTLSPQSKAYDKNMSDIQGIMRSTEDTAAQAKPLPPRRNQGDQSAPPAAPRSTITPRQCGSPDRKHAPILTKADAIRLHDEKIKRDQEERDNYAKEQAHRFHRASVNGKSFDAMFRRADKHHAKVQAKAEEKARLAAKVEREEREERDRKRREHLSKELNPAGDLSWREIQEAAEISRRETAEKRKQELAASCQAPAAAGSAHADQEREMRAAAKRAEYDAANSFTFKAEDPDKVAIKLAKQNAAWERTLEEEREKVRQRMAERLLNSAGKPTKSPLAGMERRAAEAAARRAARQAAKDEKLATEAAKKAEIERKKTEKLYNTKVPEEGRRLTKAAEYRANVVRAKFEAKAAAQKKEEDEKLAREKQEKEMSRMLSYQIKDWEKARRESMPGYHELSEAELEQNRREARKNYKANMKRNQERLKEVLNERPSLLQRHEQAMASKTAATQALSKVAAAVKGNKSSGDYDNDDFDFFNEEEKVKLSVVS
jgi:hypothetical protein